MHPRTHVIYQSLGRHSLCRNQSSCPTQSPVRCSHSNHADTRESHANAKRNAFATADTDKKVRIGHIITAARQERPRLPAGAQGRAHSVLGKTEFNTVRRKHKQQRHAALHHSARSDVGGTLDVGGVGNAPEEDHSSSAALQAAELRVPSQICTAASVSAKGLPGPTTTRATTARTGTTAPRRGRRRGNSRQQPPSSPIVRSSSEAGLISVIGCPSGLPICHQP
jgi:hypothetical protein